MVTKNWVQNQEFYVFGDLMGTENLYAKEKLEYTTIMWSQDCLNSGKCPDHC